MNMRVLFFLALFTLSITFSTAHALPSLSGAQLRYQTMNPPVTRPDEHYESLMGEDEETVTCLDLFCSPVRGFLRMAYLGIQDLLDETEYSDREDDPFLRAVETNNLHHLY